MDLGKDGSSRQRDEGIINTAETRTMPGQLRSAQGDALRRHPDVRLLGKPPDRPSRVRQDILDKRRLAILLVKYALTKEIASNGRNIETASPFAPLLFLREIREPSRQVDRRAEGTHLRRMRGRMQQNPGGDPGHIYRLGRDDQRTASRCAPSCECNGRSNAGCPPDTSGYPAGPGGKLGRDRGSIGHFPPSGMGALP